MSTLILPGNEVTFSNDEIIVSKTDLKGLITYTNKTFCTVAGYTERELLGQPHSIIRHAAMPRCVFKLVWERVQQGCEIFGYVVNRTRNNDYYWVLAHITPSFDENTNIVGFHSNRRVPEKRVIEGVISPLYAQLLDIENSTANRKDGMNKAFDTLVNILEQKGIEYDEFILTL
ncbi:MAG: PAS domain-containing protein [Pseudobdellovibrionaceae bacterium]|jgi:PAS domain S-box-containing protein|nr:PAS domain-containing protein [Pseudobdellovibrionaceae bacterium]